MSKNTETDRERKERFINGFDQKTINDAVRDAISSFGMEALCDFVIDEISQNLARDFWNTRRRNRQNRELRAAA